MKKHSRYSSIMACLIGDIAQLHRHIFVNKQLQFLRFEGIINSYYIIHNIPRNAHKNTVSKVKMLLKSTAKYHANS